MKPKAIFLGALIDIGSSVVGGTVLSALAGLYFARQAASFSVVDVTTASCGLQLIMFVLGTAYTVLGGFACGRLAGEQVYRNAAMMGLISTAFGFWSLGAGGALSHTDLLALSSTLPAALIGARLSMVGQTASVRPVVQL